jgi:hypothetical protein
MLRSVCLYNYSRVCIKVEERRKEDLEALRFYSPIK